MSSPFTNYDTWLATDRMAEDNEAEFEAFIEWCEEEGHDDADPVAADLWQAHLKEINRLEDESIAAYHAEHPEDFD